MTRPAAENAAPIGLWPLFSAFFRLGCTSFGGGTAAWLYRDMVLKRGWIDEQSFAAMLGIAQVMPGANGAQMAVLIGQRLRGGIGAIVGVFGLLSGPFVIVLGIGAVYAGLSGALLLHRVLDGVAAAVIGLTLSTGWRTAVRGTPGVLPLLITAVTVFCVGILRWPMLPVLAGLAPLSIGLAWNEPPRNAARG